jgi:hypothetical protein
MSFFYSFTLLFFYSFLIPPAFAQNQGGVNTGGINIGEQFKFFNNQGVASIFPDLGTLVNILVFNAYILAGVVFLLLLIFGGIGVIMGSSGGNSEQTAKGGKAVAAALIGFLIIFLSYWIIRIIEVITGMNVFNPGI